MAVIVHHLALAAAPEPADRQVAAVLGRLVAVYRDAFSALPYTKGEDEAAAFARFLPEHAGREGFRLVVAEEEGRGDLVGFAYGHENASGQGWHEVVARSASPQLVAAWLTSSFRLAEMAVVTRAQGRGIGGRLHDCLLAGLPYRRAVLSTMAAETNAYRLYRKRGWQVLLDGLQVPGLPRPSYDFVFVKFLV
jgi:GNAT superfamily N-acetyltransferase